MTREEELLVEIRDLVRGFDARLQRLEEARAKDLAPETTEDVAVFSALVSALKRRPFRVSDITANASALGVALGPALTQYGLTDAQKLGVFLRRCRGRTLAGFTLRRVGSGGGSNRWQFQYSSGDQVGISPLKPPQPLAS